MTQTDRTIAFEKMRSGEAKVIVATDLCARGLDSEHLDLVINFDLPNDLATYQHRVGRAGRFGSEGMTINLIASNFDSERLKSYQAEQKVELKVIDTIECLKRLGEGVENLKELCRLESSSSSVKTVGTGIPQELLEFLMMGTVEELAMRQQSMEFISLYHPVTTDSAQEYEERIQQRLRYQDRKAREQAQQERRKGKETTTENGSNLESTETAAPAS